MEDEGKLYQQNERGNQAADSLRGLGNAFTELRTELMRVWEQSKSTDTESRENIWLAIKLSSQVEAILQAHVTTGKFAREQLEALSRGEPASGKRRKRTI